MRAKILRRVSKVFTSNLFIPVMSTTEMSSNSSRNVLSYILPAQKINPIYTKEREEEKATVNQEKHNEY